MQNYLAKASILVQLKLKACQNHCTEFLSNCVNAYVSRITSMSETTRKAEILQKITQEYIKSYGGLNYRHGRITTQNCLVNTCSDVGQTASTAETMNKLAQ